MKETKTSVIKAVKPLPNQDQYGNFTYSVEFENGESGLLTTKTDQVGSIGLIVGKEFEYDIEKKVSKAGKDWFKISKPQKEFKPMGGQSKDPAVQKMIVAQSSISSAVEFLKSRQPATAEDVLQVAEKFFNYVMSKGV